MNTTEKLTAEALQMRVDSYGAILAHGDYTLACCRSAAHP